MKISKLEAAKRQLIQAVNLYFKYGDPVAIHTLVGAAHEILSRIAESRGLQSTKEALVAQFPKEDQPKRRKELNKAKNFFKHANKETIEDEIEFDAELNDIWLMDACITYELLTGKKDNDLQIFVVWFMTLHPDAVLGEDLKAIAKILQGVNKNREAYYEATQGLLSH